MKNRRLFSRIDYEAKIKFQCNEKIYIGVLQDISLKGIKVNFSGDISKLSFQSKGMLSIKLPSSEIVLDIEATLTHKDRNTCGLRFNVIEIEVLSHLKSLISLNTGDGELIDNELGLFVDSSKIDFFNNNNKKREDND